MKRVYVSTLRTLRQALAVLGVLRLLNRWAARSRTGLWARSLFSIFDLDDLLALDVPWWTFTAADKVEIFLDSRPNARVFEWGSGASTVWLARRAGSVYSVEHDPAWADIVRPALSSDVTLQFVPAVSATGKSTEILSAKSGFEDLDFSAYVNAIDDVSGEFDLIIIDGRARNQCFARALERLTPGGMLLFDNVDRQRYRTVITHPPVPIRVTWTRGMTPALPYPTRTALVHRLE